MEIIDKILKLGDMGFSKDEIAKLVNQTKLPEIEEIAVNQEKPAEPTKEEPKMVEVKDNSETNERLKTIEDTLKNIQANNLKWSNMPTVEEKSELDIVQEILGGIKPNGNE